MRELNQRASRLHLCFTFQWLTMRKGDNSFIGCLFMDSQSSYSVKRGLPSTEWIHWAAPPAESRSTETSLWPGQNHRSLQSSPRGEKYLAEQLRKHNNKVWSFLLTTKTINKQEIIRRERCRKEAFCRKHWNKRILFDFRSRWIMFFAWR